MTTETGVAVGGAVEGPAKKKRVRKLNGRTEPAASTISKPPRKKPVRRVFGRILKAIEVVDAVYDKETGEKLKDAALKNYWFELKPDGLHVRRFRARRSGERTWTFKSLANVAKTQMELFV